MAIVSYMRGRDQVSAGFGLQMLVWTDVGDAHSAGDYPAWPWPNAGRRPPGGGAIRGPYQGCVMPSGVVGRAVPQP
ncbi:hypothetical protein F4561_005171 [Lipingzhangella halophila]|uniref:Uncharacterized protein n=1 Tax=Lipingzhangella halophila TaxID=1783352 RepID=A0A7W7W505_9ACTN|nr:hypothetical protein [Lipingzhangella halophila]MBB4934351.1 hypothetical protein [Lipingzhangella halophila]